MPQADEEALLPESHGQRWQVESSFSRHKRLLGSSLRSTAWPGQKQEMYLRVLLTT